MNLSDFLDSNNDLCSPLALDSGATLHLPSRPPGREAFPLLDGAQLIASIASPIRAVADGVVTQTNPLVIAHRNNVLSLYRWDGSPHVSSGASVTCGQSVGQLADGASLHFEIGVSLCAPQCDPQNFMSLDPRPVLNQPQVSINADASLWRGSVPLEAIPLFLRRAIVAVEDRRFYDHNGIDVARIGKALVNNLRHRKIMEGASTITQQAARSALHITQRTWFRKLIEIPIALALERFHNKDKILELYFNSIYWGRGATNVAAAAIDFFGKNVWALNLKECALLAALPNHPLRWEVSAADIARLEVKCEIVLRVMREQNVIDDFILAKARAQLYQLVLC
ncbi:MAG: transglycosylase domain-containing protein [Chloroflexi bacterium]|nr:transglycosylase domain-containing protein [Chloroflexota bacterium]